MRHLIDDRGHHRITIDPAAANADSGLQSMGLRAGGVMRQYERDADGTGWHHGLPMELLAEIRPSPLILVLKARRVLEDELAANSLALIAIAVSGEGTVLLKVPAS